MHLLDLKCLKHDLDVIPDFQNCVEFDTKEFFKICKNLSKIGSDIIISLEKQSIAFITIGDSQSVSIKHNVTKNDEDENSDDFNIRKESKISFININHTVRKTFALRFLQLISSAYTFSDIFLLKLDKNSPLLCSFEIFDIGTLNFYLAAKIEEDEDSN